MNTETELVDQVIAAEMETDFARSAWYDRAFSSWFAKFATAKVLFNGARGKTFFTACDEFVRCFKVAPGESGDAPEKILTDPAALSFFKSVPMPKLPGGAKHKPTAWQMDKARRYLQSRHNVLLSEQLAAAEKLRAQGDIERADMLASVARREFSAFTDSAVPCTRAFDDCDAIMALAEDNPPLFTIDGELGRLLNPRLKGDNLGIMLANQKVGKTTDLVTLAMLAGREVPTLFVSTGDESAVKINARCITNASFKVVQPEWSGSYAMPIPDCAHNANGTCPLKLGGAPRQVRSWKALIEDGATPEDLADGVAEGSRAVDGTLYQPCCRCFPKNDGTREDAERRKHWRSGVWWRRHTFERLDRNTLMETRRRYETASSGGGLMVSAYPCGKLSVDGLSELLDSLDRVENFVPRVIIIDYADLMKQETERESDKDHDGMRRIWEGLRAISSNLNVLIITATQANRLGGDIETHTVQTIGRCAKAADNCTWMLTLNQTIMERRAKIMRASLLFAREGRFDPEQQAMCCQWHEIQDGFAFSMPVFCKIKTPGEKK